MTAAINQVIAVIPEMRQLPPAIYFPPSLLAHGYLSGRLEGEAIAPEAGLVNGIWGFPDNNTEYVVFDVGNDAKMASNLNIIMTQYTLIKDVDGVMLFRFN